MYYYYVRKIFALMISITFIQIIVAFVFSVIWFAIEVINGES